MLFKLFIAVATLFGIVIFAAVAFRVMPMDVARDHIRPALAVPPSTSNFALMVGDEALVLPRGPADVAADIALKASSDGAILLAGQPQDGFVTYVYRSRLMGFPDLLSLTLDPTDEWGTRVQIFSRSRFGYGDLGVNSARVADWVDALHAAR